LFSLPFPPLSIGCIFHPRLWCRARDVNLFKLQTACGLDKRNNPLELKKSARGADTQLPGVLPGGRTYDERIVRSRHFLEGLNALWSVPGTKRTDALAGSVQGWSETIHTSSKPALKW
jgi:hypothetical protein